MHSWEKSMVHAKIIIFKHPLFLFGKEPLESCKRVILRQGGNAIEIKRKVRGCESRGCARPITAKGDMVVICSESRGNCNKTQRSLH